MTGGVELSVGFHFNLKFGISKSQGFFLDTGAQDELGFSIAATIPGLVATGKLAFLQLDVKDGARCKDTNGNGRIDTSDAVCNTRVAADFSVDLNEPSGDKRLTLGEISSTSFGDLVTASFDLAAAVDLEITASFDGNVNFPSVATDFVMEWNFLKASTKPQGDEPLGGKDADKGPRLAFNNVRVNAGEFLGNFVKPIVDKVNSVIEPVKPVVEFLDAPLPVISDLVGEEITMLDIAGLFIEDKRLVRDAQKFVRAVKKIIDFTNIPFLNGEMYYSFGDFQITGDVRSSSLSNATPKRKTDSDGKEIGLPPGTAIDQIKEFEGPSPRAAEFLNQAKALDSRDGRGFYFPLLEDPFSAINLLLGKT